MYDTKSEESTKHGSSCSRPSVDTDVGRLWHENIIASGGMEWHKPKGKELNGRIPLYMRLVGLGPTQHQTGVIHEHDLRPHQKQRTWFPGEPPVWQQHINLRTITTWKHKHLQITTPNKHLSQPMICRQAHLEIAIAHPILMTDKKSRPMKPRRHQNVLKAPFISETFFLSAHPCQQRDQSSLVIYFFATAYELRVCLIVNAKTAKSTATTPMISAFSPSWDGRIPTFADKVPSRHRIAFWMHLEKASNLKNVGYRLSYSKTENGGGLTKGALQWLWWSSWSFGCICTFL